MSETTTESDDLENLDFTAGDEDAGRRLDVVLGHRIPALSRRGARKMALAGRVSVGGARAAPSHRVQPGDIIRVNAGAQTRDPPPDFAPLEVTDSYVFAPKPAQIHTHRLRPDQPPALSDWVAALHPECASASPDPREGGAVHRLDRDTSGVVVFARTPPAWTRARDALRDGVIDKLYLTMVSAPTFPPNPPEDCLPGWIEPVKDGLRVRAPVGRGARRSRAAVTLRGLQAETIIKRLDSAHDGTHLLQLHLLTGRRHQARIHLAWLGMPIQGDRLYGSRAAPPFLLHAWRIDLGVLGPAVSAPPPREFREGAFQHGLSLPGP